MFDNGDKDKLNKWYKSLDSNISTTMYIDVSDGLLLPKITLESKHTDKENQKISLDSTTITNFNINKIIREIEISTKTKIPNDKHLTLYVRAEYSNNDIDNKKGKFDIAVDGFEVNCMC